MEGAFLSEVSRRIKDRRLLKRLTLQELATKTNVTKGLISQIENGRSIPSLPVLFSIIHSLEMEVGDFFEGLKFTEPLVIIRRKEEDVLEKENPQGFHYHKVLTKELSASSVDIVLLELSPASKLQAEIKEAFTYQYVLSGEMNYTIKGKTYRLQEGDSLFFNGRIPHAPENHTQQSCRLLIIYFFNQR